MRLRIVARVSWLSWVSRWSLVATAVTIAACGVLSPEEQLLTDFFEASRLYDTTVMARMSGVTWNPRVDGIVQAFDVEDARDDGAARRVDVRATIRQPDGAVGERMLVFTLVRKDGRWFITAIDRAGADGS